MAKDLKHRVPAFRPKPKRVSIRWIVIIGFLAIAIILGVRSFLNPLEPAAQAEEVNVVLARGEHNQKLQFSFYKLLPDLEKELSEADITNETRKVSLGQQPTPGLFYLQLGSFTERTLAERLKKGLEESSGLKPKLELIKLEHAAWYRLKLGPYKTIPDAVKVRAYLKDLEIDSIIQIPVP